MSHHDLYGMVTKHVDLMSPLAAYMGTCKIHAGHGYVALWPFLGLSHLRVDMPAWLDGRWACQARLVLSAHMLHACCMYAAGTLHVCCCMSVHVALMLRCDEPCRQELVADGGDVPRSVGSTSNTPSRFPQIQQRLLITEMKTCCINDLEFEAPS